MKQNREILIIKPKSVSFQEFEKYSVPENSLFIGTTFDNEYKLFEQKFSKKFLYSEKYHPLGFFEVLKLILFCLTHRFEEVVYIKNNNSDEKNLKGRTLQSISRANAKSIYDIEIGDKVELSRQSIFLVLKKGGVFLINILSFLFKVSLFLLQSKVFKPRKAR